MKAQLGVLEGSEWWHVWVDKPKKTTTICQLYIVHDNNLSYILIQWCANKTSLNKNIKGKLSKHINLFSLRKICLPKNKVFQTESGQTFECFSLLHWTSAVVSPTRLSLTALNHCVRFVSSSERDCSAPHCVLCAAPHCVLHKPTIFHNRSLLFALHWKAKHQKWNETIHKNTKPSPNEKQRFVLSTFNKTW